MNTFLRFCIDHFPDLLDLNLTASVVILFVICVRQFLKGAPKIFSYALWGIVLLRLLVPVSIESPMSFVPERGEFSDMVEVNQVLPEIQFEAPQDRADNAWQRENTAPGEPLVQTYRSLDAQTYLTFLWLGGMSFLLLRGWISWRKLKKKVRVVLPLRKGIYLADDIQTAFVMGFFPPEIYLPGSLTPEEREYIIAHERHHIRRGDHVFKILGFLALSIHWFNPFVWAAFILAGRDMEMSCDEAVIRKLGEQVRGEYAESLLNLAVGQRLFAGTPLAFGDGDPAERVRNLAKWKKPATWVILICLILCAVLAVCLLTDPERPFPGEFEQYFRKGEKAELLSGISQEEYADSWLTVSFRGSSGPQKLKVELWYQEPEASHWLQEDTAILEIQDSQKFRIPSGCTFAVAATAEEGNGGYARIGIIHRGALQFDEFEHDLLTDPDTKSAAPDASAWTVPTAPAETEPPVLVDWGVTLVPDRVSRTGATALFSYSGSVPGQDGAELTYGDYLSLERLENGEWTSVEQLPGYEYFVGDSSYPVTDGYGMVHEWDNRFGELPDGTYRMGKSVTLEYPDGSRESRLVYGEFSIPGSILTGPIPLENLPEKYGAEQAMIDGCLVSRDGWTMHNKENFREFAESCARGEPGFFRIVDWYYGENSQCFVYDLNYDGEKYTVTWLEDGVPKSEKFRFLKHFAGEKERENIAYDAYEYYVLVNDDAVTWPEIFDSMISSQYGAVIDHKTVYADYIYYPKKPQLPEKPDYAILEFEDDGLITVTNSDRLEKLISLFENAEYLGYEPKTHSVGVGLNLIFVLRDEDYVIELDPDRDICRIGGEYVWYGKADEPDYIEKLWEYLGITQWPDIVYTVCENALRP